MTNAIIQLWQPTPSGKLCLVENNTGKIVGYLPWSYRYIGDAMEYYLAYMSCRQWDNYSVRYND